MKPLAQNTLIQNRYLIVQLIGKGGMGEVYLAVDQRLGSAVALKRTYFAGDEMLGSAFEREARTLARMRHPVLPKVSDHFGEGEEQYLVMEHISGDDLSKRLETAQKPFPISWVLFWADQLLDALSYLHSHEPPIIHRDIKPQNLKLTDENNIILLDFGLSKTSTGMTNISQSGSTGSVVGYTPHYAPMEQIRGIGTSARSDLYSLSATLYQLLANKVPPDALSRADAMLNGSPDPVQPLTEANPEVSKSVSDVILKGMEVSQEKRFADAREMQKVLRHAFTEMQEAMSAKTVAFSGLPEMPDVPVAEPAPLVNPSRPQDQGVISAPLTIVDQPGADADAAGTGDVDLEATIATDRSRSSSKRKHKQSEVKTEVFAGSNGVEGSAEPAKPTVFAPAGNAPPTSDDSEPEKNEVSTAGYNVGSQTNAWSPPNADRKIENFGAPVAAGTVGQQLPVTPAGKSGGKSRVIFGGLAAFAFLALAAAIGGWFVYSNYFAKTAAVQPTPSPATLSTPSPSPEPTLEAAIDNHTNANSDAAASANSNTSTGDVSAVPVAPPAASTAVRQSPDVAGRPAPGNPGGGRTSNSRPASQPPGPKAAPKPKAPSDRTVILQ